MTCFLRPKKTMKASKPMKPKGKQQLKYEAWRDTIAKPYLDKHFGHVCSIEYCEMTEGLEVDHKLNRGSRADLKMVLTNVQYLCHTHHQQKTYHEKEQLCNQQTNQ
jgi:hypothetical protein